jgi:hypothetical protein
VRGTVNRATVEKAIIAARKVSEAKAKGSKLCTEILSEFANLFRDLALDARTKRDMRSFARWSRFALDAAKAVAPFQSPTFRPIDQPAPPPDPRQVEKDNQITFKLRVFEAGKGRTPLTDDEIDAEEGGRLQ